MPYKLQESFLNTVRKRRVKVSIYIVNGVRLQGRIRSFDLYTILLEDGRQQTLIYKHAVTTIIPHEHVDIEFEEEGVPGQA